MWYGKPLPILITSCSLGLKIVCVSSWGTVLQSFKESCYLKCDIIMVEVRERIHYLI